MSTHQSILTRAAVIAVAAFSMAGCRQDPNQNSMVFPDGAVALGSGGGSGTPGTGGSSVATRPIVGSPVVTFDTTTEGFAIETFHDTAQVNLGDPASAAATPPTLAFNDTDGSPAPGSLVVTAPYSGASQYVDIQKSIQAMPQNWMGKTMHVRIQVSSGTFRGGVQLYAKTGMAFVFGGSYVNFAAGSNWQEFTLNVTSPMTIIPNYDPTRVFSFGLQLNTGSAGAGSTPVTFNIDSFSIDPPIAGAGTGAGGAGGAGAAGGAGGAAGAGTAAITLPDASPATGADASAD